MRSTTAPELHSPIHAEKYYTEKSPRPVESEPVLVAWKVSGTYRPCNLECVCGASGNLGGVGVRVDPSGNLGQSFAQTFVVSPNTNS